MSAADIISARFAYRRPPLQRGDDAIYNDGLPLPGEIITMRNGEVWFHPYSGNRGAPWRLLGPSYVTGIAG